MITDVQWEEFRAAYDDGIANTKLFMKGVYDFFSEHPSVCVKGRSVIHSMRSRVKELDHLRAKIERKSTLGRDITPATLFREVTDISGVRLLLLFQHDFDIIDKSVRSRIDDGDWVLRERAKAFTWDPEATKYFEAFELDVERRDTFYTSVHYLIKPRADSDVCCELQVRTLFEEIWGEIDHRINYPVPTTNESCREQLMVLSKLVGAGSRLVDSIQRSLG